MNKKLKKIFKNWEDDPIQVIAKIYLVVLSIILLMTIILLVKEFNRGQYNTYADEYAEYNNMNDYIEIEHEVKNIAADLYLYIDRLIENDEDLDILQNVQIYSEKIIYGDPYTESLNPNACTLDWKICELSVMVSGVNSRSKAINESIYNTKNGKIRSFSEINKKINKEIDSLNEKIIAYNDNNKNDNFIKVRKLIDIKRNK